MDFHTLEVSGWIPAIKGMRNPLKSYDKADSGVEMADIEFRPGAGKFVLGPNDYKLAKSLWKGGTEHRKWMRQVIVWVEITAPRYWFSEFDTYRVGVSANSESTMHRLIKDGIKKEDLDFNWGIDSTANNAMENLLFEIEMLIDHYKKSDKETQEKLFLLIKGLVPESFLQKRTVCLNYEVLATMYRQRKNHRLPQWSKDFVSWIETLPYNEFITGDFND